jgi:hypothetical protein
MQQLIMEAGLSQVLVVSKSAGGLGRGIAGESMQERRELLGSVVLGSCVLHTIIGKS